MCQYSFFRRLVPQFYSSQKTDYRKLDGLKVFPEDSELVEFARQGWAEYKKEPPELL
jgi:hypothetical protein